MGKNRNKIDKKLEKYFMIGKKLDFMPKDVIGEHVVLDENLPDFARHIIPPRDQTCPHCQALLWLEERTTNSRKNNPKFNCCCVGGKVKILPGELKQHALLEELLKDNHFMSKIRFYNAAFAFVSFKANSDNKLSKNNVYTYRIQGMVHHRAGPLLQNDPKYNKQCAQIYIMDGEQQEQLRLTFLSNLIYNYISHDKIFNSFILD